MNIPPQVLQACLLPLLDLKDLGALASADKGLHQLVMTAEPAVWLEAAARSSTTPRFPVMDPSVPAIVRVLQGHWQTQQALTRGQPSASDVLQGRTRNDWAIAPDGSCCAAIATNSQHVIIKMLPDLQTRVLQQPGEIKSMRWCASQFGCRLALIIQPAEAHAYGRAQLRQYVIDAITGCTISECWLPCHREQDRYWSPEARFLVLNCLTGDPPLLVSLETGQQFKLSCQQARLCVWTPDSSAFAAQTDGRIVVYQVRESPLAVQQIMEPVHHTLMPLAWCGDSHSILMFSKKAHRHLGSQVLMCRFADNGVRAIPLTNAVCVVEVQVSHNGAIAALVARTGAKYEVQVWNVKLRTKLYAWVLNTRHVSNVVFSPSDQWLAIAHASGCSNAFTITMQSCHHGKGPKAIRVVADLNGAAMKPQLNICWSPDEKRLVCTVHDWGGWHRGILTCF